MCTTVPGSLAKRLRRCKGLTLLIFMSHKCQCATRAPCAHPELPDPSYGPGYQPTIAPSRQHILPGLARTLRRIVDQLERTHERTR